MSERGHALANLVRCLRRRRATARSRPPDWAPVLEIANHHLLTPALWSALGKSGHAAALPADAGDYLATLHRLNGDRNRALGRQAIELIGALNAQGITPALLKGGLALFDGPYANPAVRMMRDLDILVPAGVESRRHRGAGAAGLPPRPAVCGGSPCVWRFRPAERPGQRRSPHRAGRSVPCLAGVGSVGPRRAPASRRRPLRLTLRHRPDHAQSAACADPSSGELLSR